MMYGLPVVKKAGIISWGLFAAVCSYLLWQNLSPFGAEIAFRLAARDREISSPEPESRVRPVSTAEGIVWRQHDDIIYFSINPPVRYDSARVAVTIDNPYPNQLLYMGYRDQPAWHYDSRIVSSPLLDGFDWIKTGTDPVLLQKKKTYASVEQFLAHPPKDALIGTYQYDKDLLLDKTPMPGYKPSAVPTVIDTPLRGRLVLYVYCQNERFRMTVVKRDLNQVADPDAVTIRIFKETDLVYKSVISDDGDETANRMPGPEQTAEIENPGPELPEPGIYKVIIDATDDVVITHISTNMQKIVFEGPLFLAGNKEAYPVVASSTRPVQLLTNAQTIIAETYHNQGIQTLHVGNAPLDVAAAGVRYVASPSGSLPESLSVPLNDVVLQGIGGYFAFSQNQFFYPTRLRIIPVSDDFTAGLADYVLTTYSPQSKGKKKETAAVFDIRDAQYEKGKLSWIINSPKLKERGRHIDIKDISFQMKKKPGVHLP